MTAQTRAILAPVLDGDKSISPDERAAVFDILEGRGTGANQTLDRVMSREEVAKMLNCSTKTVSRYAERGIIRAICLGEKGKRASNGYSAKSVEAALQRATA